MGHKEIVGSELYRFSPLKITRIETCSWFNVTLFQKEKVFFFFFSLLLVNYIVLKKLCPYGRVPSTSLLQVTRYGHSLERKCL